MGDRRAVRAVRGVWGHPVPEVAVWLLERLEDPDFS